MAIFNISINASHIRLLVISISISLITLLGLQFYWLNSAMKLQRENFNMLANNAVHEISKRIENREAISAFMRTTTEIDTNFRGTAQKNQPPVGGGFNELLSIDRPDQIEIQSFRKGAKIFNKDMDSFASEFDQLINDNQLLGNREFMLKFMREIHRSRSKSIQERVDVEHLDSLIELVFQKYSLTTDYVYEIVKADNAFFKRIASENKLSGRQNVFLSKLFPADQISSNHYLVFRFHNQRAYFFSNISAQLVLSLFAILLLGMSFYLLVDLLLRQKRLSELKTDFINNMTHELKTPIATINLASEALLSYNDGQSHADSPAKKYNKIIFEENQRLKRHVERILNIALLERSGFSLKRIEIDIHRLITRVANQSELMLQKRMGEIVLKLTSRVSIIEVDEMHFVNILSNLIDNALKYCNKTPLVSIETANNDTHFILMVTDNGIGMTAPQMRKIFDKFYRVPTGDVHDVKGFGLGLSYVLSIVELHNGSIEVNSEPGKGSTFTIKLPYQPNPN